MDIYRRLEGPLGMHEEYIYGQDDSGLMPVSIAMIRHDIRWSLIKSLELTDQEQSGYTLDKRSMQFCIDAGYDFATCWINCTKAYPPSASWLMGVIRYNVKNVQKEHLKLLTSIAYNIVMHTPINILLTEYQANDELHAPGPHAEVMNLMDDCSTRAMRIVDRYLKFNTSGQRILDILQESYDNYKALDNRYPRGKATLAQRAKVYAAAAAYLVVYIARESISAINDNIDTRIWVLILWQP